MISPVGLLDIVCKESVKAEEFLLKRSIDKQKLNWSKTKAQIEAKPTPLNSPCRTLSESMKIPPTKILAERVNGATEQKITTTTTITNKKTATQKKTTFDA